MFEFVYQTLINHMQALVPSGVIVASGEDYGVRFDNPVGMLPSVSVSLYNTTTAPIELGSTGTKFHVVYTVAAKSRRQRDALKAIVYSGVRNNPPSGSVEFEDRVVTRDMPEFGQDREKFFWNAVINADLLYLGE